MRTIKIEAGHYVSDDGRFKFTRYDTRYGSTWRVQDTTGAQLFFAAGRERNGMVCHTFGEAKDAARVAVAREVRAAT